MTIKVGDIIAVQTGFDIKPIGEISTHELSIGLVRAIDGEFIVASFVLDCQGRIFPSQYFNTSHKGRGEYGSYISDFRNLKERVFSLKDLQNQNLISGLYDNAVAVMKYNFGDLQFDRSKDRKLSISRMMTRIFKFISSHEEERVSIKLENDLENLKSMLSNSTVTALAFCIESLCKGNKSIAKKAIKLINRYSGND